MKKPNRRDLYAFYTGMAVELMLIAALGRNANLFLFSGLLLAFDVYMFVREVEGEGNEPDNQ